MVTLIMAITTLCTVVLVPVCAVLFGAFTLGAPAGIGYLIYLFASGKLTFQIIIETIMGWLGGLL